ncbi:hypothetical protein [Bradyrhizobium sp. JYMT SZCCT0428]|uniref:hypothetical protein n=1 Tax=Bradyrhizobium sp. JYMT SZCCT0428 TaxID=2807673 RepID=UPI001BAC9227|nr:hypothetical protein [Bradyrhizobium sp. JYMT SZCCT0428]MBR1152816.1 hypothetical protein [Bradyrhizobium sp. JYMT SZCCT0428]
MRTPSIVPDDQAQTIYLVANDFGKIGRAWCEADYETTDLETVILLTGQYSNPIRVVAFNTGERWSEDVSEDVARVRSKKSVWSLSALATPARASRNAFRRLRRTLSDVEPCELTMT